MNTEAKRYNKIKLVVNLINSIIGFVLLFLFIKLGYNKELFSLIELHFTNEYILFVIYTLSVITIFSILSLPVNFYLDFILEHKYNLSNQKFINWVWEGIKGLFVGALIGIPILFSFYFILNQFQELWWLPFAILMFIISVVLAKIVPIFILPLFYKILPIEEDEINLRISQLAVKCNFEYENIFKFDLSKNTKKSNAAFTGLGKTKKIILGDTLLNNFDLDEIETVLAHEIGHYKLKHIVKNIIIGTLASFLTLFIIAELYKILLPYFELTKITEISAIPLLALISIFVGVLQTPLFNMLSRKYEYEADKFAVEITEKYDIFINALKKLNDMNLGDIQPHPLVEWYYYSHPSVNNRIKRVKLWQSKK